MPPRQAMRGTTVLAIIPKEEVDAFNHSSMVCLVPYLSLDTCTHLLRTADRPNIELLIPCWPRTDRIDHWTFGGKARERPPSPRLVLKRAHQGEGVKWGRGDKANKQKGWNRAYSIPSTFSSPHRHDVNWALPSYAVVVARPGAKPAKQGQRKRRHQEGKDSSCHLTAGRKCDARRETKRRTTRGSV